jgi:hypothetical protein
MNLCDTFKTLRGSSSCELGILSINLALSSLYFSGLYPSGPPMTVSVNVRTTSAVVLNGVSGVSGGMSTLNPRFGKAVVDVIRAEAASLNIDLANAITIYIKMMSSY